MNEKKVFIILISILSCTALILVGLAVYGKLSRNGALNFGDDSGIEALATDDELDLGALYEEGKFLNSENQLRVTTEGYLANSGSESTYKINLGYLSFEEVADKVIIDAVASNKSGATLKLYVGKEKKPFLEAAIPETDGKLSDFADECIFDISDAEIKGKKIIKIEVCFEDDDLGNEFELRSLEFKAATIPTLYFNLNEALGTIEAMNEDKDNSCTGSVFVSVPSGYEGEYTNKLQELEYAVEEIHGRGNSTWDCDKKPYTMKLLNKEDLFGMGECKKWVLLANYYDKALMRDKLAYNLAGDMGMPYASKSVFVDVVMNDRYVGSYLLTEKVEVKTNRVEIQDLDDYPSASDESVINGGYLLELKPYERVHTEGNDDVYFATNHNKKAVVIESPSLNKNYNSAQYEYIEDYYHRFEEALYSYDFTNSQGERYTDLIDMDSFVDFYIINEVFKNNDALYASAFFYKDVDSKMCIGPIWDLDLSAGTYACNETEDPEGFFMRWQYMYERLFEDPEFANKVVDRYYEIRDYVVKMYSDDNEEGISDIGKYAAQLDISQEMNFEKWGMGNRGWQAVLCQGSYEAEVEYLEDWMEKRIVWLDENIEWLRP